MDREKLERLIVDASDGALNSREIEKLEKELQNYPELYQDYQAIMKLPDLANLYQADLEAERHRSSINKIIQAYSRKPNSFESITLNWFRRYALAASLAVFAITSLFFFMQTQDEQMDSEAVIEELFYPAEESTADSYVLYLEELTED